MATRKPIIGGNWKMNMHGDEAVALAEGVAAGFADTDKAEVFLCPAFPYLTRVKAALDNWTAALSPTGPTSTPGRL